jgi:hypothetical protein
MPSLRLPGPLARPLRWIGGMNDLPRAVQPHSAAWVAQTWLAFAISLLLTLGGIFYLPVDGWIKGFLGMGTLFTVGSTLSLAKTTRDLHEAQRLTQRVQEARVERLLVEHDSLK